MAVGFNEPLLPFPRAPTQGCSKSNVWSMLIVTRAADHVAGERTLISHLVSSGLDQIHLVLCLSHVAEVGDDARFNRRLKGKSLVWDLLISGTTESFRGIKAVNAEYKK